MGNMNKEIVVVTVHLSNGGAERVLAELITQWTAMGVRVVLVELQGDAFPESFQIPKSVSIISLGLRKTAKTPRMQSIAEAWELMKIFRQHPMAPVVAFLNPAIRAAGLCRPFVRNCMIFSERCDPRVSPPGRVNRLVRDLMFHAADAGVFQTHEAMEHFSKRVQRRGTVIANPVDTSLPMPYAGKRRKVIVAASRLSRQKNIPMLLYAFAKLHAEYPDYSLEIYGRGSEQEQSDLQTLVSQLELTDAVSMPGFADDVHEKMRNAAMFVVSSDYEGICNSMLEALAMGVPTICTDCPVGGAREMIRDEVSGLLVPVGDIEALYRGMKRLIDEPDFAEALGREAYKIREKYPIDKIARQWLDLM